MFLAFKIKVAFWPSKLNGFFSVLCHEHVHERRFRVKTRHDMKVSFMFGLCDSYVAGK